MVDEAALSRSSEENDDPEVPASEDAEERGDAAAAAASEAPSPSEDSPEDAGVVGKLTCSVIFLCFYGFMTSIRPGESFITPTLLSVEKNFTREQVSHKPAQEAR